MRRVFVGLMILLAGSPAALGQAVDVPEPFKSLGGTWIRPERMPDGELIPWSWQAAGGKNGILVLPTLRFAPVMESEPVLRDLPPQYRPKFLKYLEKVDKANFLIVGGGPVCGSTGPGAYASHFVTTDKEKSKGVLLVAVGEKELRLEYTLNKDILSIGCKESLPAGNYFERYNISGTWVRMQQRGK